MSELEPPSLLSTEETYTNPEDEIRKVESVLHTIEESDASLDNIVITPPPGHGPSKLSHPRRPVDAGTIVAYLTTGKAAAVQLGYVLSPVTQEIGVVKLENSSNGIKITIDEKITALTGQSQNSEA